MIKDAPEHLVTIIADVLLAFLLKVNVPVPEAEDLTDKVREKKMAELFENMEKLDIQAERKNTETQRQRAESAEQKARIAEQKAEIAEQKAEIAEQKAETIISLLIESYQAAGNPHDDTLKTLMEKLGLNETEAKTKMNLYWDYTADRQDLQ